MIWWALLFTIQLHADGNDCARAITVGDLWQSDRAISFASRGQNYRLSYSFDSEIATPYWTAKIPMIPEIQSYVLGRMANQEVDLSEIKISTGMSERQIRTFVLKKSVPPHQRSFQIADVNAGYWPTLFHAGEYRWVNSTFAGLWTTHMTSLGLPIRASLDNNILEFSHATFETSPRQYFQLMTRFNSMFQRPNTHFHMGIPLLIGERNAGAIARAVETRVVLGLAETWDKRDIALSNSEFTTLSPSYVAASWSRGVIRFQPNAHMEPTPAADLEIRQWTSQHQAFDLLALASHMAEFYPRILEIPLAEMTPRNDRSPTVGNIVGALTYAAAIFKRSADATDRALAPSLFELSHRAENAESDLTIKSEVARFLTKNKIERRLTLDKFLQQEGT